MVGSRSQTDKRVIKTKRAIKAAVITLMADRDVAEITVKDVADIALISKKTFFAHYSSVADVLEEMENEEVSAFSSLLVNADVLRDRVALGDVLVNVREAVSDKRSAAATLLRSRASNDLLDKVKDALSEKISSGIAASEQGGHRIVYMADFVAAGVVSAVGRWLESDRDESVDDVSDVVSSIAMSGLGPARHEDV